MADLANQSPTDDTRLSGLTTEKVRSIGIHAGLFAVGVTTAEVLQPARSVLKLRKERGLAGAMQFTYRNPERSTNPELLIENAQSLIAGAFQYSAAERARPPLSGRIARYATQDYYAELKVGLTAIAEEVRSHGFKARVIADQNGLVDRNVAWSAGLGSYGKNANLLLPEAGSWFVLGAVVTDLKLTTTGPPVADQCGPCTRCLDECPTQAIVAPGVVDATKCIAWLVQSDGPIPVELREAIGDRLYGCDECQEVCPPNRSAATAPEPSYEVDSPAIGSTGGDYGSISTGTTRTGTTSIGRNSIGGNGTAVSIDGAGSAGASFADLPWILSASDEDILEQHGRWYIARRDVDNIRRTALVVLGNVAEPADATSDQTVAEILSRYSVHLNPVLRGHAVWSARRLGLDGLLNIEEPTSDAVVSAEYKAQVSPRFQASEWSLGR